MFRYALLMLTILSGCGESATAERPNPRSGVTGKIWALRQIDGTQVERADVETATLRFDVGHGITGTSVCNDVGGDEFGWSADPSGTRGAVRRDETEATIVTAVGCMDEHASDIARRFWQKMETANEWVVQGGTLRISFLDGSAATLKPVGDAPPNGELGCVNGKAGNFDCPSQR